MRCPFGDDDTGHVEPAPEPVYPFPAEAGALTIVGETFRDEHDRVWSYRGADGYAILALLRRGIDPTPKFKEARADGANVIRFFGEINWEDDTTRALVYPEIADPLTAPLYDTSAQTLFRMAAEHGLRVEWTVLTYPDAIARMREKVQRAFDLAVGHWNVFIEVANEPDAQGINARAAIEGVNRRGVLSSLGYYDLQRADGWVDDKPETHVWELSMLDYVTVHTDRGPEWVRKAKDALEIRGGWDTRDDATQPDANRTYWKGANRPVVGDEPIGAAERDEDGRRSTSPSDFRAHFAIGHLYSAGTTFHSTAGLEGRARRADEVHQAACAAAVLDVWKAIPPDAQLGEYARGGLGNLPIEWDGESASLRDYGLILGSRAWVAIARKRPGRQIVAKPGWRIVHIIGDVAATGVESYLVELERT